MLLWQCEQCWAPDNRYGADASECEYTRFRSVLSVCSDSDTSLHRGYLAMNKLQVCVCVYMKHISAVHFADVSVIYMRDFAARSGLGNFYAGSAVKSTINYFYFLFFALNNSLHSLG